MSQNMLGVCDARLREFHKGRPGHPLQSRADSRFDRLPKSSCILAAAPDPISNRRG